MRSPAERERASIGKGDCGLRSGATELSLGWKLSAIYDLSKAVRYLHANGILHRDIKPKNCLVSAEINRLGYASVKLGDFGLAKSAVHRDIFYCTFYVLIFVRTWVRFVNIVL